MTGWKTSEASPLQSRGFVVSAAGVGLLMLAAVFLIVATIAGRHAPSARQMALGSHAGGATPATGGRASAGGGGLSVDDPRGCSLSAGSQAVPVTAPVSGWALVGSTAAPTARSTVGPQKSIDGLRVCFAHSPTGALFAAASFWAEATAVPQTVLYGPAGGGHARAGGRGRAGAGQHATAAGP